MALCPAVCLAIFVLYHWYCIEAAGQTAFVLGTEATLSLSQTVLQGIQVQPK